MNVFGIGLPEMALIMVIALLVFGPKKLPEIGRSMGKALKSFQEASKEFENEFKKEADRINETLNETPMEATLETPKAQDQPQPQLEEGQEMAEAPTDEVMADSPEVTNS
ncbi:TatA/E family twin arginine-targeting protein translocase [Acaryochloris marina]|uniref:TatA/E family twin arginine-targeting protein translocase n=1 Tax=Acaryochloris marina TaxID=155978 RepID=UPI001BAFE0A2|nr:TatA/E family twin arginine-targeting protein translocase [Acaryochloris marina]QUY40778.1 TatA/E family twin arginine-targeting protein translocase [Acaryochloris marina S15]